MISYIYVFIIWLYTKYFCNKVKDGLQIPLYYRQRVCYVSLKKRPKNYIVMDSHNEVNILNDFELRPILPITVTMFNIKTNEPEEVTWK